MLVYVYGHMYYSTLAVWSTSLLLLATLPAGVWLLYSDVCLLSEQWLVAIDWALATCMVMGALTPVLQWNLTPSGRADLYVLHSASCVRLIEWTARPTSAAEASTRLALRST